MTREEVERPSVAMRAAASLAAALVLVLMVLAASPELHERLHGHGPVAANHDGGQTGGNRADDEDGCVVTLFAHGFVLALALAALVLACVAPRPPILGPRDREIPAAPRYLRLPSQAPPVGLS